MDIEHEAQFGCLNNNYCNFIMDNMTINNGDDLVMAVERGDLLKEFVLLNEVKA